MCQIALRHATNIPADLSTQSSTLSRKFAVVRGKNLGCARATCCALFATPQHFDHQRSTNLRYIRHFHTETCLLTLHYAITLGVVRLLAALYEVGAPLNPVLHFRLQNMSETGLTNFTRTCRRRVHDPVVVSMLLVDVRSQTVSESLD